MRKLGFIALLAMMAISFAAPAIAQESSESLVVYSGRNEELIGPVLAQFTELTGVQVNVVYGDTASIANQILEEGANSPADVYISQDAGALGALAKAGILAVLPPDVLERVPAQYASDEALWVGLSARARVLVYNPALVEEQGIAIPTSILDLTKPEYAGLVGWAPANASFQSNVTAMRLLLGEEATAQWLADMVANGAVNFGSSNTNLNRAVASGEVLFGITNHYYMFNLFKQEPDLALAQTTFAAGDAGNLVNLAGASVLATSDKQGLAQRLLLFMLSSNVQSYFATATSEYPLIAGVEPSAALIPLESIGLPEVNLNDLDDLSGTLTLIENSGALD